LILENLKVKPRKHDLEKISMAIAAYLLGVPITKLGIPPSTIYYYTRKLGVRKRREIRPNCPSPTGNPRKTRERIKPSITREKEINK